MPWPDVRLCLDNLRTEHRRQQAPLVQLTWLVAGLGGSKLPLEAYYTGYAREPERQSVLPKRLARDLNTGLALGLVSQQAYDALTM